MSEAWSPDAGCQTCHGLGYVGRPPSIDRCPDCGTTTEARS
ncbi:hypothetical protein [Halovivax asiaticus]|nr:hypothetical protein [Halovivax asiaticus]